jgi:hypothetical protein
MASIQAFATVSRAILSLLERSRPDDLKGVKVAICRTDELSKPPPDGVTLCLHRVSPNQTLRITAPGSDTARRRAAPPLPVDLHYLLTAWAPSAERQQLLLAWAMRTLEDTPVLSAELLNRSGGTSLVVFRNTEAVELAREPATPAELSALWDALRVPAQPSIAYVARTVLVDARPESSPASAARTST